MKVLVTGSEGYIGSNLRQMFPESWRFIGYDVKRGLDVCDTDTLSTYVRDVDAVIHLAALSGHQACESDVMKCLEVNIFATEDLADLCSAYGVDLVYAASFAPTSTLYGFTKAVATEIVLDRGGRVFYLSNVYGGSNYVRMKDSLIAKWIKRLKAGRPIVVYGNGSQKRDFIHVVDVCRNIIRFVKSDYKQAYICTGVLTSVNLILNLFRHFVSKRRDLELEVKYELRRKTYSTPLCQPTFPWDVTVEQGVLQLLNEEFPPKRRPEDVSDPRKARHHTLDMHIRQ